MFSRTGPRGRLLTAGEPVSSNAHVTSFEQPPYSPSKQRHQFSGVRGFVAKSPVDLHKVCVLQLSADGLQLVVRLVNNLGRCFRQGFCGVIPLPDSLPDLNQFRLCFPCSISSISFLSSHPSLILSKAPYLHLNMLSFSTHTICLHLTRAKRDSLPS